MATPGHVLGRLDEAEKQIQKAFQIRIDRGEFEPFIPRGFIVDVEIRNQKGTDIWFRFHKAESS